MTRAGRTGKRPSKDQAPQGACGPLVRSFEDRLRHEGRSPVIVRKARRALWGGILAEAQERGLVAQNVVYSLRKSRRSRRTEGTGKLMIGVDIPAPAEMRAIVGKLGSASGRYRPLLLTAIFTGLRASELRGLRWADVDLKRGEVHVRQRADRGAKYKGLHALRHFYASWCINRRVDGGLELQLKVVQARLGHSSVQMTADTYAATCFRAVTTAASLRRQRRRFLQSSPAASRYRCSKAHPLPRAPIPLTAHPHSPHELSR